MMKTIIGLLCIFFIGLFLVPCIVGRIMLVGAHIAWAASADILGPDFAEWKTHANQH